MSAEGASLGLPAKGRERAGRARGGDGERDGEGRHQRQRVRVGRHSGEDGYQWAISPR
jgi:hypothetical protein